MRVKYYKYKLSYIIKSPQILFLLTKSENLFGRGGRIEERKGKWRWYSYSVAVRQKPLSMGVQRRLNVGN